MYVVATIYGGRENYDDPRVELSDVLLSRRDALLEFARTAYGVAENYLNGSDDEDASDGVRAAREVIRLAGVRMPCGYLLHRRNAERAARLATESYAEWHGEVFLTSVQRLAVRT
jgi:hypothetical protein